jgi:hypothetical protein
MWQKIMRSANSVGNAGPHVRQTFLNDVFTFLTKVGTAGHILFSGHPGISVNELSPLSLRW